MEKELPNTSNASKTKGVERENSIIRCYEIASDLTLLYLQKADRASNSSSGQSAGQSTWSVASAGTTGSTSPVQPPIGTMNGNLAVPGVGGQGSDDNQSIFGRIPCQWERGSQLQKNCELWDMRIQIFGAEETENFET